MLYAPDERIDKEHKIREYGYSNLAYVERDTLNDMAHILTFNITVFSIYSKGTCSI